MRTFCAALTVSLASRRYASSGTARADSYSKAVQKSCAADYHKYCGDYGLENPALRTAWTRTASSLSKG